jgi:hypothetical protein
MYSRGNTFLVFTELTISPLPRMDNMQYNVLYIPTQPPPLILQSADTHTGPKD